jgi:hypothetical protein
MCAMCLSCMKTHFVEIKTYNPIIDVQSLVLWNLAEVVNPK